MQAQAQQEEVRLDFPGQGNDLCTHWRFPGDAQFGLGLNQGSQTVAKDGNVIRNQEAGRSIMPPCQGSASRSLFFRGIESGTPHAGLHDGST
jgi:hypothetical protein